MSASDSNFVAAKKNGFACSGRGDYDLPRPILIFVAAKKNGFACSDRGDYDVRVRFYFSLPPKEMVSPATDVAATRSASDSNLRCRKEEWFRLQRPWR